MREVRAPGQQSPAAQDVRRCGLAPLVDLHVSVFVRLDPGRLQPDAVGVRGAAAGDEQVRPLDHNPWCAGGRTPPDRPSTRGTVIPVSTSIPLVPEELFDRFRHVGVFPVDERAAAHDDRHAAAEPAQGLGQFEPDVAAAQNDQVPGGAVQFQGFDVRERPCLSCRPGVSSIRAREPVLMTTFLPRSVRMPPALEPRPRWF